MSEKLPVTFELRESDERPAVVRYGDHCLKIYRDRIEYRDETKYWKGIIKCGCGAEEKCKTYASVPLTRTKEIATCNDRISNFAKGDHIHFWITRPKDNGDDETMGHFYVSSSGVAWVEKNCRNPEIKSWAELDKWWPASDPAGLRAIGLRQSPQAKAGLKTALRERMATDRTSPSG